MSKLGAVLIVGCLFVAFALAEPRLQRQQQQQQQLQQRLQRKINSAGQQHPYLFLTVPRGRANAGAVVKGFEIVEEEDSQELDHLVDNDNDDDDNQDDDDEEDELEHQLGLNFGRNNFAFRNQKKNLDSLEEEDDDEDLDEVQESFVRNAKLQVGQGAQQMVVARDQAGAIMVPDGIIEIEGQSVLDEKTGKAALLVPRAALDAIPDGAVVALMERSANSAAAVAGDEVEEERANRVVVRRRKNSGRRNIRRRGTNVQRRRRRPSSQRRRRGGNRRRNVRVVRPNNRRRGNQRRRGQVVYQG